MKLHVIFPFHTEPNPVFSHCAFTGKAERFVEMMRLQGFDVIEYSNGRSDSAPHATERVEILTSEELNNLRGPSTFFHGDSAQIGGQIHREFSARLMEEILDRWGMGDIICHPFGHPHADLGKLGGIHVESGIGYPPDCSWAPYRVYESYAWLHYSAARANRQGTNYEWVVPNYYRSTDWEPKAEPGRYLLFAGRICAVKGLDTLGAISERLGVDILVAGQGDMAPWKERFPRLQHVGSVQGRARSDLFGNARAIITPTHFIEPFCGTAVEAMLTGTPVIAPDFGAFTETVLQGVTGFRCRTLGDYCEAVSRVAGLDRQFISERAQSLYSLTACGAKYKAIFEQISDLSRGGGWYSMSHRLDVL